MKTNTISLFIALLLASTLVVSGCSNWSNTARGAVIGTGAGAAAGAVIGKTLGNTAAGALAGAAVGGSVGAIIGRNMDRKAERLEREMDGVTIQRVEEGIAVSFDSGLLFGFDSADLRETSKENLRKLAAIMAEDNDTNLMIVGHTDSIGDENYNLGLSERRARSAASYLIEQGIASNRVQIEGRGEYEPIADNETEAGRQENRRVEVAIFASEEYIARLERANQ
jgi:outer membrane protein OmpA-like peptidoglycan-associated protein